uniref:Ig-like domain-containing protein n=1 Tax=Monopterus albus TaxID=43700 RepID=A0A3Q3JUF5_MONAL
MFCVVGSEISMMCMLSGSLPMTLSWIKDEHELTEDEHVKMSYNTKSAVLNLKNTQLSHGGKYVCQAQNKAGTQRCATVLIFENNEATLRIPACEATHSGKYTCQVVNEAGQDKLPSPLFNGVVEPPTVQEKPEVVKVTCGDPVTLECKVAGSPQIRVRWSKDGQEFHSSRKHHLCYENNLSSFHIRSSQLDDAGEYLFEATNSVGTCTPVVVLNHQSSFILEPPYFVEKMESVEVTVGDPVTLKCCIAGTPDISVAWFKDGGKCRKTNTCSMDFANVRSDHGKYAIVAKNSSGQAQATILVNVLDTPGACQNLKVAYVTKNSCMVYLCSYLILQFRFFSY